MENLLCNSVFECFWNGLQGEDASFEGITSRIKASVAPVAEMLHIGRLEGSVHFSVPFESFGNSAVFYTAVNGFDVKPLSFDFPAQLGGNGSIQVYPQKGHSFNESESRSIQFLINTLFTAIGHARLMSFARKASTTDLLTGAANQAFLREAGSILQGKGELNNFTAIFINLKNFKFINKTIGPKNGDIALKILSQRIKSSLVNDEVFSRLGGDNFFALLRDSSVESFIKNFSAITIADVPEFGNSRCVIRLRMGVYKASQNDSINVLMSCSSIALNVAKKSRIDDIVYFVPSMFEEALYQREISSVFPEAHRNQEFAVYYQPKIDTRTNMLYGCEALVRWYRNGKWIMPMEFLPVLENEGSVCKLDFYVFERVCRNIRQWMDADLEPVCVSVNFSKLHLKNPNFAENILDVMKRYKVPSKFIEVELTEVSDFDDSIAFAKFVNTIRAAGVTVSIDDFGTGYSTFNVVKNLDVDVIKLDKSLFDNLHEERDSRIVKNLVSMMKDLGIEVVAEGIETAEQIEFLKKSDCNIVQGFYYDKPMTYEEFKKRLVNKSFYLKD